MSIVHTNAGDKELLPDSVISRIFQELDSNDTLLRDGRIDGLAFKNFGGRNGRRSSNGTWIRTRGGKEAIFRLFGEICEAQVGCYGDAGDSNDPVSLVIQYLPRLLMSLACRSLRIASVL